MRLGVIRCSGFPRRHTFRHTTPPCREVDLLLCGLCVKHLISRLCEKMAKSHRQCRVRQAVRTASTLCGTGGMTAPIQTSGTGFTSSSCGLTQRRNGLEDRRTGSPSTARNSLTGDTQAPMLGIRSSTVSVSGSIKPTPVKKRKRNSHFANRCDRHQVNSGDSIYMHSTRIRALIGFTVALLILWPTAVKNQCRKGNESVIRVHPLTKRLPISDVEDFRVQGFETQPLVLLTARVRAGNFKHTGVYLTVQNVASQGIRYFEYGVSSCPHATASADIVVDNGSRILKPQRKARYTAPTDGDLEALLKAATVSSCKPLLTLVYVEFKDGTCWWPHLEAEL